MKSEKEFTGKLLGFDDYVSKYQKDTISITCMLICFIQKRHGVGRRDGIVSTCYKWDVSFFKLVSSENTKEGYKTQKLEQILLNGNNICAVSFFFFMNLSVLIPFSS